MICAALWFCMVLRKLISKSSVIYDVMFCRGLWLSCEADRDSCMYSHKPCVEIWTVRLIFISFHHSIIQCDMLKSSVVSSIFVYLCANTDQLMFNAGLILVSSKKVSHNQWLGEEKCFWCISFVRDGIGSVLKFTWKKVFVPIACALSTPIHFSFESHLFCYVHARSVCYSGVFKPLRWWVLETLLAWF